MTGRVYGPQDLARDLDVSRETLTRLEAYGETLVAWQARINLVGPTTCADLWRRHMLDSGQLMAFLPPPPQGRARHLLDLGAGAGFPGLVLAILGAGQVHLVDADGRKCAFLRAAARAAGVSGMVAIHQARVEKLAPFPVDVITARAFAPLPRLFALAAPFASEETDWLLLKGQDVEEELTQASISWTMQVIKHESRSDPRGTIVQLKSLRLKKAVRHAGAS
ncbi:MAG: 16S rRNA (guanine(527)-N(7))-methyltransferase RsmG [Pseudomonadota bacterium]